MAFTSRITGDNSMNFLLALQTQYDDDDDDDDDAMNELIAAFCAFLHYASRPCIHLRFFL
jgi:hypothetical protein